MSTLLEQASLVLIPSGYKEDVVYSQIPTNGSGDLSFTRASNGTRINSAGLVEVCPWNLIDNSNNFSAGAWVLQEVTSTSGQTDPTGASNGWRFNETTATGQHRFYYSFIAFNTGVITQSIYVKSLGRDQIFIGANSNSENFIFTFSTETISSVTGFTSTSATNVGNGWYRLTATFLGFSPINCLFVQGYNGGLSYAGDTSKGFYAFGAQLNIGSTAKPYFPTTDRLNVPRLTYQNGGGGCPSLLLEKQSTNLQIYSEQFNSWSNTDNLTVSANSTTSPDGTQNADKLNENSSSGYHIIGDSNITLLASTIYTTSFFAKASERSYARMLSPASNYAAQSAYFDLTNGNCSASAGTVSTQSMGNGWYRCVWSLTTLSSVSGGIGMWIGPARNMTDAYNTYTGTSGSGIFAYGAQIEQSSYPTSYIPTTSATATRVADACFKTGISSLIGQSEGVVFVDYVVNGQTNSANILNSEKNTTCSLFMGQQTDGDFDAGLYVSGSLVGRIVAPVGLTVGQRVKVAYAYKSGSFALYINGNQAGILSSTFTLPTTLDDIFLNDETFYNYQEAVKYNQVALFKTRLTNAELASLTTI